MHTYINIGLVYSRFDTGRCDRWSNYAINIYLRSSRPSSASASASASNELRKLTEKIDNLHYLRLEKHVTVPSIA